jgi:hypothetical protein
MAATNAPGRTPVLRMAWLAFALALFALLLAWYGSLHAEKHIPNSPLRSARGAANVAAEPGSWYERTFDRTERGVFGERFDKKVLETTERSKVANYLVQFVAFLLPLALGLLAAFLGGNAMSVIEKSGGSRSGNFHCVFAIMIGGFAAVIGACMIVSVYLWPSLPSIYTV